MADVSIGMGWDYWKTGEVSVRVEDDEEARVYRIKAKDLKAIYDSIERSVIDAMLFEMGEGDSE